MGNWPRLLKPKEAMHRMNWLFVIRPLLSGSMSWKNSLTRMRLERTWLRTRATNSFMSMSVRLSANSDSLDKLGCESSSSLTGFVSSMIAATYSRNSNGMGLYFANILSKEKWGEGCRIDSFLIALAPYLRKNSNQENTLSTRILDHEKWKRLNVLNAILLVWLLNPLWMITLNFFWYTE